VSSSSDSRRRLRQSVLTQDGQPSKRMHVSLGDKQRALELRAQGLSSSDIAAQLNVKPSTVRRWGTDRKGRIEHAIVNTSATKLSTVKHQKTSSYPGVELQLVEWITQMVSKKKVVNRAMIAEQARRITVGMAAVLAAVISSLPESDDSRSAKVDYLKRLQQFKASDSWVTGFCGRNGVQHFVMHGEAASVSPRDVEAGRTEIKKLLANAPRENIYNTDETALFYEALPSRTFALQQPSGIKASKKRLTVLATCSAAGEKIQLLAIGTAKKPRCFKGRNVLPCQWASNKTAWMTSEIFTGWLNALNAEMRRRGRHIILTMDNFAGHVKATESIACSNVTVVFFVPNVTAHLQPLIASSRIRRLPRSSSLASASSFSALLQVRVCRGRFIMSEVVWCGLFSPNIFSPNIKLGNTRH
jgi:DDE superfamily endonuclease/Tc5 transposase DNA-binding domain/Homeodomain-like domain